MTRSRRLRVLAATAAAVGVLPLAAAASDLADPPRDAGPLSAPAEALQRRGRVAFDLAVQRPLELVELGVSLVVFVPAYPVGWLFGADRDVLEICVSQPFDRVFRTPLGEL